MAKQTRVPETHEVKPNREQRRHPDKVERPEDAGISRETQEGVVHGPQDVTSVRARSSGHGKKTADKWNQ